MATRVTKPWCYQGVKTEQQKKYPNPEEPWKSCFSSSSRLFLKLQEGQQNTRITKATSVLSYGKEVSVQCFPSPPDYAHCISPSSLPFTEQSNSGPCCNSSHWRPDAADFLAFPSPPIQLTRFLLPAQAQHLPVPQLTSLHHKHLFCPCIYLSWCSMNFTVFTFLSLHWKELLGSFHHFFSSSRTGISLPLPQAFY